MGRCLEVVGEAERERLVVRGGLAAASGLAGPVGGQAPPADSPVLALQFKRRVQESTQVLRELEISLRTNHIG